MDPRLLELVSLFERFGDSQYGGEAVSQLEHALQAARLASNCGASNQMIAAALLHDVGHLLHDLPADAPELGIDDRHETIAARYLDELFVEAVVEPIRLHVPAKRYLCRCEAGYYEALSPPSKLSLELQGGVMSESERREFESSRYHQAAVQLRRWDDEAKEPGLETPSLSDFLPALEASLRSQSGLDT